MNRVSNKKRGFSFFRAPWGWDIEWYDGKGTYLVSEEHKWWWLPIAFVLLWWEARRG